MAGQVRICQCLVQFFQRHDELHHFVSHAIFLLLLHLVRDDSVCLQGGNDVVDLVDRDRGHVVLLRRLVEELTQLLIGQLPLVLDFGGVLLGEKEVHQDLKKGQVGSRDLPQDLGELGLVQPAVGAIHVGYPQLCPLNLPLDLVQRVHHDVPHQVEGGPQVAVLLLDPPSHQLKDSFALEDLPNHLLSNGLLTQLQENLHSFLSLVRLEKQLVLVLADDAALKALAFLQLPLEHFDRVCDPDQSHWHLHSGYGSLLELGLPLVPLQVSLVMEQQLQEGVELFGVLHGEVVDLVDHNHHVLLLQQVESVHNPLNQEPSVLLRGRVLWLHLPLVLVGFYQLHQLLIEFFQKLREIFEAHSVELKDLDRHALLVAGLDRVVQHCRFPRSRMPTEVQEAALLHLEVLVDKASHLSLLHFPANDGVHSWSVDVLESAE